MCQSTAVTILISIPLHSLFVIDGAICMSSGKRCCSRPCSCANLLFSSVPLEPLAPPTVSKQHIAANRHCSRLMITQLAKMVT